MKYLLILACILISCQTKIQNDTINDAGKRQIGENLYLKKIYVGSDRVYILVNEKDEVVGNTSTSYTVHSGKTSRVESNSFINLHE